MARATKPKIDTPQADGEGSGSPSASAIRESARPTHAYTATNGHQTPVDDRGLPLALLDAARIGHNTDRVETANAPKRDNDPNPVGMGEIARALRDRHGRRITRDRGNMARSAARAAYADMKAEGWIQTADRVIPLSVANLTLSSADTYARWDQPSVALATRRTRAFRRARHDRLGRESEAPIDLDALTADDMNDGTLRMSADHEWAISDTRAIPATAWYEAGSSYAAVGGGMPDVTPATEAGKAYREAIRAIFPHLFEPYEGERRSTPAMRGEGRAIPSRHVANRTRDRLSAPPLWMVPGWDRGDRHVPTVTPSYPEAESLWTIKPSIDAEARVTCARLRNALDSYLTRMVERDREQAFGLRSCGECGQPLYDTSNNGKVSIRSLRDHFAICYDIEAAVIDPAIDPDWADPYSEDAIVIACGWDRPHSHDGTSETWRDRFVAWLADL